MHHAAIVSAALILLPFLLYFEKRESRVGLLATKPLLSLLFIAAALVQPHPREAYFNALLPGLVFCLGGDIFLIFSARRVFLMGLVSFLIGHVFYAAAFFRVADIHSQTWIAAVVSIVFGCAIFAWLRPHLGAMKGPVLAYIAIISLMAVGGTAVLGDEGLPRAGRWVVFAGAVSFYVSDIFVARQRFVQKQFCNRLLGLPLYYAGQFLLAFSVGLL